MKIRETWHISQKLLSEFGLIKAKTEKTHGFTSEATSHLVVERVMSGKQKVFRGIQKKQTSTEVYPAVVLANWAYSLSIRANDEVDIIEDLLYIWLLQAGYQVYVWSNNGPIHCINHAEIKNQLNQLAFEKTSVIKSRCLKALGECTILDFDKTDLLILKIRMTSIHSRTHADILIDATPATLQRLRNQTENQGLNLDYFKLNTKKARTSINAYLREYGTSKISISKKGTINLLAEYPEILLGNVRIGSMDLIKQVSFCKF